MKEILIQSAIIFCGIISLTFLQGLHYKMLYFMVNRSHGFFKHIIQFIIRFGTIIHEICHLIFGFIGGSRVQNIELFRKDGGRVTFATKNYIGALAEHHSSPGFIFLLFFNQIGIFLTSLGPLIFGLLSSFIFVKYFHLPLQFNDIQNYEITSIFIVSVIFYVILIPSFILSYQDIKHFFVSKQESIGASIVGSILNTIIFIVFLGFLTFFFEFFLIFGLLYITLFLLLFCVWGIFYLFHRYMK